MSRIGLEQHQCVRGIKRLNGGDTAGLLLFIIQYMGRAKWQEFHRLATRVDIDDIVRRWQ